MTVLIMAQCKICIMDFELFYEAHETCDYCAIDWNSISRVLEYFPETFTTPPPQQEYESKRDLLLSRNLQIPHRHGKE